MTIKLDNNSEKTLYIQTEELSRKLSNWKNIRMENYLPMIFYSLNN